MVARLFAGVLAGPRFLLLPHCRPGLLGVSAAAGFSRVKGFPVSVGSRVHLLGPGPCGVRSGLVPPWSLGGVRQLPPVIARSGPGSIVVPALPSVSGLPSVAVPGFPLSAGGPWPISPHYLEIPQGVCSLSDLPLIGMPQDRAFGLPGSPILWISSVLEHSMIASQTWRVNAWYVLAATISSFLTHSPEICSLASICS